MFEKGARVLVPQRRLMGNVRGFEGCGRRDGRRVKEAKKKPQRVHGRLDLRGRGACLLQERVAELREVGGGALAKRGAGRGVGEAAGPGKDLGLLLG